MTDQERRFRAIVFGAYAVFFYEEPEPDPGEVEGNAEAACRDFISGAVDPLDVDFRDYGSANVTHTGNRYRVSDRMAVDGDLVRYRCTVERGDGNWRLVDIDTD